MSHIFDLLITFQCRHLLVWKINHMGIAMTSHSLGTKETRLGALKSGSFQGCKKEIFGRLQCSALADREMCNKCGRGAESGHKPLLWC